MKFSLTMLIFFAGISHAQGQRPEDFLSFLARFYVDSVFQRERVQFPLTKKMLNSSLDKVALTSIPIDEWKYIQLLDPRVPYLSDIRYSFTKPSEASDQRVLAFIGLETGINTQYYFQRRHGRWYLIRWDDFSS